eukprot:4644177-Amphidinium_carterae.2
MSFTNYFLSDWQGSLAMVGSRSLPPVDDEWSQRAQAFLEPPGDKVRVQKHSKKAFVDALDWPPEMCVELGCSGRAPVKDDLIGETRWEADWGN